MLVTLRYTRAMTMQTLIEKATLAGYEIRKEENRVLIHKTDFRKSRITSGVWVTVDGNKFVSAFRTDIDLALTITIRSVSQTAKALGL